MNTIRKTTIHNHVIESDNHRIERVGYIWMDGKWRKWSGNERKWEEMEGKWRGNEGKWGKWRRSGGEMRGSGGEVRGNGFIHFLLFPTISFYFFLFPSVSFDFLRFLSISFDLLSKEMNYFIFSYTNNSNRSRVV